MHLVGTCTGLCMTKRDFIVAIWLVGGSTDPLLCLVVDGCSWGWTDRNVGSLSITHDSSTVIVREN